LKGVFVLYLRYIPKGEEIMRKLVMIACIVGALAGCASPAHMTNRDVGTGVGGVAGGAIGYGLTNGSALGTVGGTLGGGYIGNQLAR
jgi:hypothetical protein